MTIRKKKYLELEIPINSSMFKPIKNTPDYPWRERQRELPREDQISKSNFKNIREIDFTWKRFLSRIKYVMKIFTFFLYVFFRHQTGGYPAKLGDWKDLMIHYGCIPPNDKLNIRLFGLLRMYLGIFTLGTI